MLSDLRKKILESFVGITNTRTARIPYFLELGRGVIFFLCHAITAVMAKKCFLEEVKSIFIIFLYLIIFKISGHILVSCFLH